MRSKSCGFCWRAFIAVAALVAIVSCSSRDNSVNVAVAANFTETAREIAQLFKAETGDEVVLSSGSTGQLFTQITQDAPFEVFLSADQETPRKAVDAGFATADSLFTYAIGKLVLYGKSRDLAEGESILRQGQFEKIAIANPETAPYGAAALEAMKSLGIYEQLNGKIVQGNSIAQAFQFVETANAEIGFVALSQVVGRPRTSTWMVPEKLYSPIRQDAVLLKRGAENEAARAFLTFLKSPRAKQVMEKYGYATAP